MARSNIYRRGAKALAILGACLASAAGCAYRDGIRRGSRSWRMEAEGTTIGRDLRAAPRGTTIPMTSLGVDLVDRARDRDAAFARAGFKDGETGKSPARPAITE